MILFIVILLGIFLRILFFISSSSDNDPHFTRMLRAKYKGFSDQSEFKSLKKGVMGYPILHHWIVSFVSPKRFVLFAYFLVIFYDILLIVTGYFFFKIYLDYFSVTHPSQFFVVGLSVLAFNSALHPTTARVKGIGARSLSSLLVSLYFISLMFPFSLGFPYYYYVIPLIFGSLVFYSSQMGLQAFVFISFFLSIFYLSITPILLAITSIALCFIVPLGGFDYFFHHKVNHWKWYFKMKEKGTTATGRNSLRDHILFPYYLFKRPFKAAKIFFVKSSIFGMLQVLPALIIIIVICLFNINYLTLFFKNPVVEYSSFLFLSAFSVFFLTSFSFLSFLGQAERYFEYTVLFTSFIVALFVGKSGNLNLSLTFVLIHLGACFIKLIYENKSRIIFNLTYSLSKDESELIEFLEKKLLSGEQVFALTIPFKYSYKLTNYFYMYKKFMVFNKDVFSKNNPLNSRGYEEPIIQLPNPNFDYFKDHYGVNFLILDKTYERLNNSHYFYDFSDLMIVFENDSYLIYSFKYNS